MDRKDTGLKEILEKEVTRESLIALSYTEPQKNHATGHVTGNPKDQYVETLNNDGAERYRSKLISISYSPSPEAPSPQVLPRKLNG
ncbi:hypothetical protein Leryth_008168 [Lithospermum erythrorhizon]|uniref:Uncharacterized protein n=1 Tax=Lithospermum erythrorhizon TaxID=34254 RepID=A0AAV3NXP7_LITER|nr:hypothetical protein Leryth_008168 [Lithospermum erythrorhizon]